MDEFGDEYKVNSTIDYLEALLKKIPAEAIPHKSSLGNEFISEIRSISSVFLFFGIKAFFTESCDEFLELQFKLHGGSLVDTVSESMTHVVCTENDDLLSIQRVLKT
jgi:hypothetical protein